MVRPTSPLFARNLTCPQASLASTWPSLAPPLASRQHNGRGGIDRFETTFSSSTVRLVDYLRSRFEFLLRRSSDKDPKDKKEFLCAGINLAQRARFTSIDKMSRRLDGNLDRLPTLDFEWNTSRVSNVIPGIEQSLSRPLPFPKPSKRLARYYDLQRRRKLELLGYFSDAFLSYSRFLVTCHGCVKLETKEDHTSPLLI